MLMSREKECSYKDGDSYYEKSEIVMRKVSRKKEEEKVIVKKNLS
jgi:hypothetical protein